jgi:hypothetical protein
MKAFVSEIQYNSFYWTFPGNLYGIRGEVETLPVVELLVDF